MHKSADELRDVIGKSLAAMDAVSRDHDLVPEAKARKIEAIAKRTLAQQEQSTSLQKTRDVVERQVKRWAEPIAAVVKPAANEAEAVLHGDIRRFIANLKDPRERMSFLEARGSDPVVASSILEAPLFLSGVSDTEAALVRRKIEQRFLPREIIEAKSKVVAALDELERGFRAGNALIMKRAKMQPEMPSVAKAAPMKSAVVEKEASRRSQPVWAES